MEKQKRDQIKKKIRKYAPAAATITASVALGTVTVVYAFKNANRLIETANKLFEDAAKDMLPEVTGEEKKRVLESNDTFLQKIEENLYFLSIGTTDED